MPTAAMQIDMLPAGHGDCLVVQCAAGDRTIRVLVDGGTTGTAPRLRRWIDEHLPSDDCTIDVAIITHIDADHIGGALRLLDTPPPALTIRDIWFNGRQHLTSSRGVAQGERLSLHLNRRAPIAVSWNGAFDSGPVIVPVNGALPTITLNDKPPVTLTLLSPTTHKLERMAAVWDREVARIEADEPTPEGAKTSRDGELDDLSDLKTLSERRSDLDTAAANGSSIAFLLESDGTSALFAADAHPDTLAASIRRLNAERGNDRLTLDAFKLPHHASEANVTVELLELVSCTRYLISTNSSYFNHPDPAAIARAIITGDGTPELHFNYRSARTELWSNPDHIGNAQHPFIPIYPTQPTEGLTLRLAHQAQQPPHSAD